MSKLTKFSTWKAQAYMKCACLTSILKPGLSRWGSIRVLKLACSCPFTKFLWLQQNRSIKQIAHIRSIGNKWCLFLKWHRKKILCREICKKRVLWCQTANICLRKRVKWTFRLLTYKKQLRLCAVKSAGENMVQVRVETSLIFGH